MCDVLVDPGPSALVAAERCTAGRGERVVQPGPADPRGSRALHTQLPTGGYIDHENEGGSYQCCWCIPHALSVLEAGGRVALWCAAAWQCCMPTTLQCTVEGTSVA